MGGKTLYGLTLEQFYRAVDRQLTIIELREYNDSLQRAYRAVRRAATFVADSISRSCNQRFEIEQNQGVLAKNREIVLRAKNKELEEKVASVKGRGYRGFTFGLILGAASIYLLMR